MTPLARSNVNDLVAEINAQNTHALSVFLPVYEQYKLNADRYRTANPPIDPGKPPVGPAIGTVDEELAGKIFDEYEASVQARVNTPLGTDGKNVPVYDKGHEEPDYSPAIRYKLYVPATDDSNPTLNTNPLPPGDEIPNWEGHYAVSPGDHAPAGKKVVGLDGRTYVKIAMATPFGNKFAYVPVALPVAA